MAMPAASPNATISAATRRERKSATSRSARRVGLAQRLLEVRQHGRRQTVGGPDFVRHVDADALRIALLDDLGQPRRRQELIVGARFGDQVAARAEGQPLDAIGAAIGEHVVADP
jgi:hypothetical protein